MNGKKRLLIVGDYSRKDFSDAFFACKEDFDFFFIEFASPDEIVSDYYKNYGKAIYWKDFSDAYDLLNKVNPFKVVFYFIESFNHVALNVACKTRGVRTYHLDHGFRNVDLVAKLVMAKKEEPELKTPGAKRVLGQNLLSSFLIRFKTRLFFLRTIARSEKQSRAFLKHYFKIRKANSISETFRLVISSWRTVDEYISFCPANFQEHIKEDHLSPGKPVHFIGMPVFDKWTNVKPASELRNYFVFIGQPLVEQGVFGWDHRAEERFICQAVSVCRSKGYQVFVKLHPYQNEQIWREFSGKFDFTLITDNELEKIIPFAKCVAGYYSTLLIPMAVLPHTTVLSFETHPMNSFFPSAFLVNSQVSHRVNSVSELAVALDNLQLIHKNQTKHKAAFAADWMLHMDGKSGERLKEVLLRP